MKHKQTLILKQVFIYLHTHLYLYYITIIRCTLFRSMVKSHVKTCTKFSDEIKDPMDILFSCILKC